MSKKKSIKKLEHVLRRWEKKYGYIGYGKRWLDFFSDMKGKSFTLYIEDEERPEREIDRWGRIYVGRMPLDRFKVGETLVCFRDPEGNYHLRGKERSKNPHIRAS